MVDPSAERWADSLYCVSLLKQEKVREITALLPEMDDLTCLDVGGDNGVVSLMLRRLGGTWSSADLDQPSVEAIHSLVGERVSLVVDSILPYDDGAFDCVVLADCVEHVQQDQRLVREAERVLTTDGVLILNVPRASDGLIRRLKLALGQTDARHGHVRPGYTRQGLVALLSDSMAVDAVRTYSRFFTQLVDLAVVAFARLAGARDHDAKGTVVTQDTSGASLRAARLVYPVMWLVSQLDRLLLFTEGHMLIVRAIKSDRISTRVGDSL